MLGYPERAVRLCDAAHEEARRRRHPFNLGWALTVGARYSIICASPTSC